MYFQPAKIIIERQRFLDRQLIFAHQPQENPGHFITQPGNFFVVIIFSGQPSADITVSPLQKDKKLAGIFLGQRFESAAGILTGKVISIVLRCCRMAVVEDNIADSAVRIEKA
ncbi:hypothetical protein SDC9_202575 [bioreactor metagenome]|uniref:Uncharacterized protein n=1 Tax=bioreactor metagenome TaxID=1076179 RepID=A0A645IUT4_9ZZZZ